MKNVLVVDDKDMMRDSVCATLQRAGFTVTPAADGHAALALIAKKRPDVVVSDLKMPGLSGIDLVSKVREIDEDLPVVLMTAFGTIETAVAAMKRGAFDYLTKPFEGDELIITVKRAIEHGRLIKENAVLRASVPASVNPVRAATNLAEPALRTGLDRLIGSGKVMRTLKEQLTAIASSQGTVLITGESGAGKEVIARAIHELSPRRDGPFLAVNCAALSESLLESELFGHERGAFTGAEKLRKGRFELADGGTLLLDEISEISPKIQAKLLRVLQERSFERVGSSVSMGVDVRVIATSNRDLPASVEKGEFRQDLYFRLGVLPVAAPPLRERAEDVPELASHFAAEVAKREGRPLMRFDPAALDLLKTYAWPGNVRELQNICERAVVLSSSSRTSPGAGLAMIRRDMLEPWLSAAGPRPSGGSGGAGGGGGMPAANVIVEPKPTNDAFDGRTLEEIEREAIIRTLHLFDGHRQKTATALGIGVRTLGLKLKKWKQQQLVSPNL